MANGLSGKLCPRIKQAQLENDAALEDSVNWAQGSGGNFEELNRRKETHEESISKFRIKIE
jgi:hypothetical protein